MHTKTQNIGIIGQGFVGMAIKDGFSPYCNVYTYDKYIKDRSNCNTLSDVVKSSSTIFICVPTPMNQDGSCNTNIVGGVVSEINTICRNKNLKDRICVIKSTVQPGTTDFYNKEFTNISCVFNPEFLVEATAKEDFKNQSRIIIGGPRKNVSTIKNLYRTAFRETPIVKTNAKIAESVKYFINCFLATKVSFSNEFKQMCDVIDVDYDKVVEYALYDKRLGESHWSVPGPDGDVGFGGSCFPKDINAIINFGAQKKVDMKVLQGAWNKNLEVRPGKDWEKLKGRAVTDDQPKNN